MPRLTSFTVPMAFAFTSGSECVFIFSSGNRKSTPASYQSFRLLLNWKFLSSPAQAFLSSSLSVSSFSQQATSASESWVRKKEESYDADACWESRLSKGRFFYSYSEMLSWVPLRAPVGSSNSLARWSPLQLAPTPNVFSVLGYHWFPYGHVSHLHVHLPGITCRKHQVDSLTRSLLPPLPFSPRSEGSRSIEHFQHFLLWAYTSLCILHTLKSRYHFITPMHFFFQWLRGMLWG